MADVSQTSADVSQIREYHAHVYFSSDTVEQARELCEHAKEHGKAAEAAAVTKVIDEIMARPEHKWQAAGKKK